MLTPKEKLFLKKSARSKKPFLVAKRKKILKKIRIKKFKYKRIGEKSIKKRILKVKFVKRFTSIKKVSNNVNLSIYREYLWRKIRFKRKIKYKKLNHIKVSLFTKTKKIY